MIRFFSSNEITRLLALPLILLLLSVPYIMEPTLVGTSNSMPFFQVTFNLLIDVPYISLFLGLSLIFLEAFLLNNIVAQFEKVKTTYLPAFVYVLFMANGLFPVTINAVLVANLFLILSLNSIFKIYISEEKVLSGLFNTGFYISLASLFYLPSVFFFVVVWIGLLLFRASKASDWMISLSGLIIPYLYVLTYNYWNDNLGVFFKMHFGEIMQPTEWPEISVSYMPLIVISVLIGILAVFQQLVSASKINVHIRKLRLLLLWFFITALLTFLFVRDKSIAHLALCAIPFSVIVSNYFQEIKNKKFPEILFWIVVITIFIARFSLI